MVEQGLVDIIFSKEGAFAGLFIFLFLYELKSHTDREKASAARETRYQEIIAEFGPALKSIQDDVKDIKKKVNDGGG